MGGRGCGGRIRTDDLRVMSPTSYHCSTPLVIVANRRDGGRESVSAAGGDAGILNREAVAPGRHSPQSSPRGEGEARRRPGALDAAHGGS